MGRGQRKKQKNRQMYVSKQVEMRSEIDVGKDRKNERKR